MYIKSPLIEVLTGEIHHRSIAGLLTVLVLLLHAWVVILLLQPNESDDHPKPLKIMEVALVSEPKPIAEPAPPAPKPPPKIIPPKKKEIKPQPKKKPLIIHKEGEILKPKEVTEKPVVEQLAPPVIVQKTEVPPVLTAQTTVARKPVAKPGNGDANSKGRDSGVVELGCPKPKYPARALSRHINGWVKIELSISTTGSVTNARVVDAQPSGIFDDAAMAAVKQCRFKPKMVNGVAVTQVATKKSTFNLSN